MFFTLLVVGWRWGIWRPVAGPAGGDAAARSTHHMYLFTRELAQAADYTSLLAVIVREVGRACGRIASPSLVWRRGG